MNNRDNSSVVTLVDWCWHALNSVRRKALYREWQ